MFDTEEFKKSVAKFNEFGSLAVTAQDHRNIGSTPPKEFLRELEGKPNPTLVELMTDEEISKWIKGNEETIAQLLEADQNSSFVKSALPMLRTELELGKKYLRSINKLPDETTQEEVKQ